MDAPSAGPWSRTQQYPLDNNFTSTMKQATVANIFLLPLALACLSALSQIGSLLSQARRTSNGTDVEVTDEAHAQDSSWPQSLKTHIRGYGGSTIYAFIVARLLGILGLLYLTLLSPPLVYCEMIYPLQICFQPIFVTFIYLSILTTISLASKPLSDRATNETQLTLLSTLGIYVYRDIRPLATYFLKPDDIAEGNILWAKIALLAFTAIVIPLATPNAYIPVDPKNPMQPPGRELTDPWISKLLFIYIDPIVVLANKVSHLKVDQLPPLLDVDYSSYITKQAFASVDPFVAHKRRNILWGLLWFFRREYIVIGFCHVICSVCTFSGPLTIVKILGYIESHGENATTKPWLWVCLFFWGSCFRSLAQNWAFYFQTVVLVRVQALLTQLVFEHSLRIRLKAETSNDKAISPPLPTPSAPSPVEGDVDGVSEGTSEGTQDDSETRGSTSTAASSSSNGKAPPKVPIKGTTGSDSKNETKEHGSDNTANLLGKIQNLVTSDLKSIGDSTDIMTIVVFVPSQIIMSMVFLSQILSWSALVSLLFILGLGPVATFFVKKLRKVQAAKMKMTDARVQTISEALGIVRMIKLFGWEGKLSDRVKEKRDEELRWVWKTSILGAVTRSVSDLIPTVAMFATYATYTVIMKEELSSSKIFSSISVLNILRNQIAQISWQTSRLVQVKVSLDRFTTFLNDTELLDEFTKEDGDVSTASLADRDGGENQEIGFKGATFTWTAMENDRYFRLKIEGKLLFKRNCINMIVGPTGSGKTSLLMALLGEMHFIPLQVDSWFNLPRKGNVAYAAQESWIQSATIKENIIFGSPHDEARYKKVIYQCALVNDLELFDAGDGTEVGERGLTLSGGQKARVTLARAIYSNTEIILLDDILAALDVHTSAWIVNKCFRGDLVKGRTLLLVTHNTALVGPFAGFVVSLGADGSVQAQGTDILTVLENDPNLAAEMEREKEASEEIKNESETTVRAPADGKLVMGEEIVEGHIRWKSMKLLLSALSGDRPILFLLFLFLCYGAITAIAIGQTWFLGVWGAQYEAHAPSEVNLYFYLSGFALIIIAHTAISSCVQLYFSARKIHASRIIHAELINSVLRSTFRWLDETPTGRIIARCTQDIGAVDNSVPQYLTIVIESIMLCVLAIGGIVLFTPIFIFPGLIASFVGALLGNWYLKAQLSIKREMSNARSPVLSHFNAAMHGLVSIRAYGAHQAFKEESLKRIDHYSRIARTSWNLNRWIGLRMDLLGAVFISLLAFYLLYIQTRSASVTGFSLNMAIVFCGWIFYLVRLYNEFEVESNSLERIQGYLDIDHEPQSIEGGKPPASWPTSGDLRVENLSARYSHSGPRILHSLSFHIKSGEHIGVVGRTGSGKSSLTLALLRCILTEGTVYYDGIPTHTINLDALRSNITIIPQVPELLSGTLRQNVDPFEQNDDAVLNDALRAAGLFSLQEEAGEAYLSLDSSISSSGGNLSIGQRQIIALARAMVRGSKLLILDEATSAIDYKTDADIQLSLRTQLERDTTVITVAHRLQTIMDADRIMVLDKGHIIEFDTPGNLLKKENGAFKALVDGSEDQGALYKLQTSTRHI